MARRHLWLFTKGSLHVRATAWDIHRHSKHGSLQRWWKRGRNAGGKEPFVCRDCEDGTPAPGFVPLDEADDRLKRFSERLVESQSLEDASEIGGLARGWFDQLHTMPYSEHRCRSMIWEDQLLPEHRRGQQRKN
jgi:hypothetical protein